MTYMFDQQKAWDALLPMEKGWGGTPQERQAARYRSYAAKYGVSAPQVSESESENATQGDDHEQAAPQPIQSDAASPAPEPDAAPAPAPSATPPAGVLP